MLVVVVVLALAAYALCELSLRHRKVAESLGRRIQVKAFTESGIDFVLQVLSTSAATDAETGLYDNPDLFQAVAVVAGGSPDDGGGFTIISPAISAEGEVEGIRFGLEDDSNRLNLNLLKAIADSQDHSAQQMLMALPGMTLEVADAVLDWLDADDDARQYGVESDYYATLRPPYAAANRHLTSISDLLLVRGVTRQLLFGLDQNQNFLVEPSELNSSQEPWRDSLTQASPRGWAAYLTLHSRDRDAAEDDAGNEQAVNVNQEDMQQLYDELLEAYGNKAWAMFIVAFRQNGPHDGPAALNSATSRDLDLTQPARFQITQALDLIGQNVQMTLVGDTQPVAIKSPFRDDSQALEFSLDELNQNLLLSSEKLPGRINIMGAPRVVLRAIPGIDDTIVDGILRHRELLAISTTEEELDELWPLTKGIVTIDQMRVMAPFINMGGAVYRAQILGYFSGGGYTARTEVVVDASGTRPQLVYQRELTHLGNGDLLNRVLSANAGNRRTSSGG